MSDKPMMQCGHAANGVSYKDGTPVCAICVGIRPGATEIAAQQPDLTGRLARCSYGQHRIVKSSTNLAFFEHKPGEDYDQYYCGCHGWD